MAVRLPINCGHLVPAKRWMPVTDYGTSRELEIMRVRQAGIASSTEVLSSYRNRPIDRLIDGAHSTTLSDDEVQIMWFRKPDKLHGRDCHSFSWTTKP